MRNTGAQNLSIQIINTLLAKIGKIILERPKKMSIF
jgi:hypothetical protein